MNLGKFLTENAGKRRSPGLWDCVCMPADWAMVNGYDDAMLDKRGAYSTDEEAHILISEAGGLRNLFSEYLGSVGIIHRAGEPVAGDIGVISINSEDAGAIFTGERWAFAGPRGLIFSKVDDAAISACWAVTNG